MKYFFLLIFCLFGFTIGSQGVAQTTSDSSSVLKYQEFIDLVLNHHPVFYTANLVKKQGEAYVLKAKGKFDPKLSGEYKQKSLEGKDYYDKLNLELNVPTKLPVEVQAGFVQNDGDYLNPENYTVNEGLMYVGAALNLGAGFSMDQRRFSLQQAEIFNQSSEIQQTLILNELKYEASQAYWDWFDGYNKLRVIKQAQQNAYNRLQNIKQQCAVGDKPCIDTLKVLIQYQDRSIKVVQAEVDLTNKTQKLELYLWQDGELPVKLKEQARPFTIEELLATGIQTESVNVDSVLQSHPEVLFQELQLREAELQTRLSKEQRKPEISLGYKALANYQNEFPDFERGNNHLIEAKISYPIFVRQGRGETQYAKLKQEETEFKNTINRAKIQYRMNASQNSFNAQVMQLPMYLELVENYKRMFEAENTLFEMGESMMILVNQRDIAWIDSQIKLVHFLSKLKISEAELKYQTVNLD